MFSVFAASVPRAVVRALKPGHWWEASHLASIQTGATIYANTMSDLVSGGADATSTGTMRPSVSADTAGPFLSFDGANDRMITGTQSEAAVTGTRLRGYYTAPGASGIVGETGRAGTSAGMNGAYMNAGKVQAYHKGSTGGASANVRESNAAISGMHRIITRHDTTQAAAAESDIFRNGSAPASTVTSATDSSGTLGGLDAIFGARRTALDVDSLWLAHSLYVFVTWARWLSDSERAAVDLCFRVALGQAA